MRSPVSVGDLAQVAENLAGMEQAVLGGFVIAGFDCRLALLLELVRVEELLALDGIGGPAVAHVRKLKRHLALELDQVRRRRSGYRREYINKSCNYGNRREKSRARPHQDGIVIESIEVFQR